MKTGYNIHEGSEELARRRDHLRVVTDHDREVADAILRNARARQLDRRSRVRGLARLALRILEAPTPQGGMTRKPW